MEYTGLDNFIFLKYSKIQSPVRLLELFDTPLL